MTAKYYVKGTDPEFDRCLPFIRKEEGGNSDDPHDHGGRTSRGIIQREYDSWLQERGEEPGDVFQASDQVIDSIYYFGTKQDHYWLPRCPALASGVNLVYFNIAVNGGHGQADKILARSIGGTDSETVERMCDNLEHFYRSLKQFPRYGNDWLGRTARCRALARKMVNQTKEKPKMPPTTTQPGPPTMALPGMHIDFHQIEQALESAARFLPIVATFVPQLKPFLSAVPMIEGVLKAIDELQQAAAKGGGSGDFAMILQSHLHAIADNVKALVEQHNLPAPLLQQSAAIAAADVTAAGQPQGSGG